MDDGVYAVGGVVGLRIRKRNGTIRSLMRWTRHGVRHDYYLPRDISLTEARKLVPSVGISWIMVKIRE